MELERTAAAETAHAGTKRKRGFGRFQFLFWILPMFALMALFCYYPPILAILHSLTDWNGVQSDFVGMANFSELMQDSVFWNGMKNGVILTLCGLLFGNISTIFLAELLYNLKSRKLCAAFRFLFVVPMLVPGIVSMLMWTKVIFNPSASGFMNTLLSAFHITDGGKPFGFYYLEEQALVSLILTGFPFVAGTSFLIYLAGLQNISPSVSEAAELDGVNIWRRIWYIDLPMLLSQIKYFVILGVIGGIQGFNIQLMITKGGPNYSTMVPGYSIYYEAFMNSRFGYACAMGVVLFLLTLIITVINNVFLKNTEGVG